MFVIRGTGEARMIGVGGHLNWLQAGFENFRVKRRVKGECSLTLGADTVDINTILVNVVSELAANTNNLAYAERLDVVRAENRIISK